MDADEAARQRVMERIRTYHLWETAELWQWWRRFI